MDFNKNECPCGGKEFITDLNSYDIYILVNGKFEWQKSQLDDEHLEEVSCRECGKKYNL